MLNTIIKTILEHGALPILGIIAMWAFKTYVIPYLKKTGNEARAKEIAKVADVITDSLVASNPGVHWLELVDEAVDDIIEALGIDEKRAKREAIARLARKTETIKTMSSLTMLKARPLMKEEDVPENLE